MTRMLCGGGGPDIWVSSGSLLSKDTSVEKDVLSENIEKKVLKIPRGVDVGHIVGSDGKMMYWINEEHLKQRLNGAGIQWEFEE